MLLIFLLTRYIPLLDSLNKYADRLKLFLH